MSKRIRNDRPGRRASPLTHPRGRLPRRVYWVRRVLVLGLGALLVLGFTRLLSYGGGDSGGGEATIVRGEPSVTTAPTAATTVPTGGVSPTDAPTGRKGLVQPSGPCDPSDVLVTPIVRSAHVASPVHISLRVTTVQSPACTFEISPETVIVRLLSPKRSEPLWTSQQCTEAVPERTVVARPSQPGRAPVTWNGRLSDEDCSNLTDWVFPGTYTAQAIAVGSTRETSSEFVLGLPIRPTVTRTPTPTPTRSGKPSDKASAKPSASPTGR